LAFSAAAGSLLLVIGAPVSPGGERAAVAYVDPAWSRAGQIAFVAQRQAESGTVGSLFVMRTDRSGRRMVVPEMSRLAWPTWSPDGRRLAFSANGQRIYVVNADGSGLVAVVSTERRPPEPAFGLFPAWSPGGRKIAYTEPSADDTEGDILVMNPDGSRKTYAAVTDGTFRAYEMPTWSPDRQRLAFDIVRPPDSANDVSSHLGYIQQYGAIVSDLSVREASEPDWSPDGRRIAFTSRDRVGVLNLHRDRRRFLHKGSHARWSPDGRRIVFSNEGQIFVMNANGSNVRQLTR
jgi:Tol biopolymer transport system component